MITKEQWQTDIQNTKIEMEAFRKIYEGFEALEQLPENRESGKSFEYRTRAFRYHALFVQCEEALQKIEAYEGELV